MWFIWDSWSGFLFEMFLGDLPCGDRQGKISSDGVEDAEGPETWSSGDGEDDLDQ